MITSTITKLAKIRKAVAKMLEPDPDVVVALSPEGRIMQVLNRERPKAGDDPNRVGDQDA